MPRPLKILHVSDRFSALGGADWYLISILDNMPADVQCEGIFGRADGSVENAPLSDRQMHILRKLDKRAPFRNEAAVGDKLAHAIDRLRPGLIHVHNILNPHLLNVLADSGPGIMTVHDHRFFCPGRGKVREDGSLCRRVFGETCASCFRDDGYFSRLLELVRARLGAMMKFRAVLVVSRYMKRELVSAGVAEERVHVVPPFVHGVEDVSEPPHDAREILYAGRVVWAKGVFDLPGLLKRLPDDVRLTVAGTGPGMESFMLAVAREGVSSRVRAVGWTPHRDMARLYRRCRLLVMPSRWQEPFGIVGLEAHFSGRPVVAYDVGGVGEWLSDGKTGFLAPAGDVDALARAVSSILGSPDLADKMGREARETVRLHFQKGNLMDRLVGIYREYVD